MKTRRKANKATQNMEPAMTEMRRKKWQHKMLIICKCELRVGMMYKSIHSLISGLNSCSITRCCWQRSPTGSRRVLPMQMAMPTTPERVPGLSQSPMAIRAIPILASLHSHIVSRISFKPRTQSTYKRYHRHHHLGRLDFHSKSLT